VSNRGRAPGRVRLATRSAEFPGVLQTPTSIAVNSILGEHNERLPGEEGKRNPYPSTSCRALLVVLVVRRRQVAVAFRLETGIGGEGEWGAKGKSKLRYCNICLSINTVLARLQLTGFEPEK